MTERPRKTAAELMAWRLPRRTARGGFESTSCVRCYTSVGVGVASWWKAFEATRSSGSRPPLPSKVGPRENKTPGDSWTRCAGV